MTIHTLAVLLGDSAALGDIARTTGITDKQLLAVLAKLGELPIEQTVRLIGAPRANQERQRCRSIRKGLPWRQRLAEAQAPLGDEHANEDLTNDG